MEKLFIQSVVAVFVSGQTLPMSSFNSTSSCYSSALQATEYMNATCPQSEKIVVNTITAAVKNDSLLYAYCNNTDVINNFDECCRKLDDDCSMNFNPIANNYYTVHERCNGETSCTVQREGINISSRCGSEMPTWTNYMHFNYYCINSTTSESCESSSLTSADGGILYIQSPNFPNAGRSNCSCSIETDDCSSGIELYTLQRIMYPLPNNMQGNMSCSGKQNLSISLDGATIESTWTCENNTAIIIKETIPDTTFMLMRFENTLNESQGSFWLGFKSTVSTANLEVNCPPRKQTYCLASTSTESTVETSTITSTKTPTAQTDTSTTSLPLTSSSQSPAHDDSTSTESTVETSTITSTKTPTAQTDTSTTSLPLTSSSQSPAHDDSTSSESTVETSTITSTKTPTAQTDTSTTSLPPTSSSQSPAHDDSTSTESTVETSTITSTKTPTAQTDTSTTSIPLTSSSESPAHDDSTSTESTVETSTITSTKTPTAQTDTSTTSIPLTSSSESPAHDDSTSTESTVETSTITSAKTPTAQTDTSTTSLPPTSSSQSPAHDDSTSTESTVEISTITSTKTPTAQTDTSTTSLPPTSFSQSPAHDDSTSTESTVETSTITSTKTPTAQTDTSTTSLPLTSSSQSPAHDDSTSTESSVETSTITSTKTPTAQTDTSITSLPPTYSSQSPAHDDSTSTSISTPSLSTVQNNTGMTGGSVPGDFNKTTPATFSAQTTTNILNGTSDNSIREGDDTTDKKDSNTSTVIIAVITALLVLSILAVVVISVCFWRYCRRVAKEYSHSFDTEKTLDAPSSVNDKQSIPKDVELKCEDEITLSKISSPISTAMSSAETKRQSLTVNVVQTSSYRPKLNRRKDSTKTKRHGAENKKDKATPIADLAPTIHKDQGTSCKDNDIDNQSFIQSDQIPVSPESREKETVSKKVGLHARSTTALPKPVKKKSIKRSESAKTDASTHVTRPMSAKSTRSLKSSYSWRRSKVKPSPKTSSSTLSQLSHSPYYPGFQQQQTPVFRNLDINYRYIIQRALAFRSDKMSTQSPHIPTLAKKESVSETQRRRKSIRKSKRKMTEKTGSDFFAKLLKGVPLEHELPKRKKRRRATIKPLAKRPTSY